MINVYPTIQGKKQQHQFYENWEEAPITAFIKWHEADAEIQKLEQLIEEQRGIIRKLLVKYEAAHFNNKKQLEQAYLKKIRNREKRFLELKQELSQYEAQAVAPFTTIPFEELLKMNRSTDESETLTDNHLNSYVNRLIHLSMNQLPRDHVNKFIFQSKTDKEIDELKKEFDQTPIWSFKKRQILKSKIKEAQEHEYKITDIWEQSTIVNKEIQDLANTYIEQVQQGDYTALPYLIALLTVEDNIESERLTEISKGNDAKAYTEEYMRIVKKIFEKRLELFTQQKNKLSVATAIRIKNFFLFKRATL